MGDLLLTLVFLVAILGVAVAAPELARQGDGRLFRRCVIATVVLTAAVAAHSASTLAVFPSLLGILIVPTLATVGSGFAALALAARRRQKRQPSTDVSSATAADVVVGLVMWIVGAAVTGVFALLWVFTQIGPMVS